MIKKTILLSALFALPIAASQESNEPSVAIINQTIPLDDDNSRSPTPRIDSDDTKINAFVRFCRPQTVSGNEELAAQAQKDWASDDCLKKLFCTNLAQFGHVISFPARRFANDASKVETEMYIPAQTFSDVDQKKGLPLLLAYLLPFFAFIPAHMAMRFKNMGSCKLLKAIKHFVLAFFNVLLIFFVAFGASALSSYITAKEWVWLLVYNIVAFTYVSLQLFFTSKIVAKKSATAEKKKEAKKEGGIKGFFNSLYSGVREIGKPSAPKALKKKKRSGAEKALCATVIPIATYFGLVVISFVTLLFEPKFADYT